MRVRATITATLVGDLFGAATFVIVRIEANQSSPKVRPYRLARTYTVQKRDG